MTVTLFPMIAALSVACGGSTDGLRVKADTANVATVGQHRTYAAEVSAAAPAGYALGAHTPELMHEVTACIDEEMSRRGYAVAAEGSDLVVRLSAGGKKVVEQPRGSAAVFDAPSHEDAERAVGVVITRRSDGVVLFDGTVSYDADPNNIDKGKVKKAVAKVLASVPPAAK